MSNFLIGVIVGLILGVLMGGFVVKYFNVTDTQIKGKIKAKKHGRIDLKNIFKRRKDGNN